MLSNRRLLVGVLFCLTTLLVLSGAAMAQETHVVTSVFGSKGSQAGQLSEPGGIAVNPVTHDVYVADTGNARVDEFSASGAFLRAWGWGVSDGFSQLETCTLSCQAGIGGSGAGQFTAPSSIAIDTSTGPSATDVYVGDPGDGRVSKFDAEGNLIGSWGEGGQLSGSSAPAIPFGRVVGVASDANGNLLVLNSSSIVFEFTQAGAFIASFEIFGAYGVGEFGRGQPKQDLGVDGAGHIFKINSFPGVEEFTSTGENLHEVNRTEVTSGMAVEQATGDIYADVGNEIERFVFAGTEEVREADGSICHFQGNAGCHPSEVFGSGVLTGAGPVGVDSSNGGVYVVEPSTGEIIVFTPIVKPDVTLEASTVTPHAPDITDTSVTLSGTVNPDKVPVSSCQFEYGTKPGSFTNVLPCTPPPGSGATPVSVSAQLTGLVPGTYYFHLIASNSYGTVESGERSFVAPGPPIISEASFSNVGSNGAVVSAIVNADGASSSFVVEYGTSSSYGSVTPVTSAGFADENVKLSSRLTGLQPGALYHFRFRVTNEFATIQGVDNTFSTLAEAQSSIPDYRGYEMVTPVNNEGIELYPPLGDGPVSGSEIPTALPTRAAGDGSAIAYVGEPTVEGNGSQGYGLGNEFMAVRTPSGWVQRDIQPSGVTKATFADFSPNLSVGVLGSTEPMAAGMPDQYEFLYTRDSADGSVHPLFTTTPPNRKPNEFRVFTEVGSGSLTQFYAGESQDSSRQFFEANDALTPNAVDGGEFEDNLYESVGGQLRLVNILPDGSTEPNASFGEPPKDEGETENTTHAVSADGSRVFWTNLNTGALYVRENQNTTVLVAEQAQFLAASVDGSRVIYSKGGDLYEDDLSSGVSADLAPGAEVMGIVGSSEDASYVYFVGEGDIASGATAGRPNLYLHHAGTTTFIATLFPEQGDLEIGPGNSRESFGYNLGGGVSDDWRPGVGHRTAQVNSNGHDLVFTSRRELTGYDNQLKNGELAHEVYVYDSDTNMLSCVSCNSSGEPPSGSSLGGYLPITGQAVYQLRLISEDGGRVFFQTVEPLVAQDVNGLPDVYEWERKGEGTCKLSVGCIYLLSGGSSQSGSYILDASSDGSDVFIETRAKLLEKDQNELYDVYDVRVGAEEPPATPQCTGTGCQGVPEPQPIFATPSSVTYNGVGNFPVPVKAATKTKTKTKGKGKRKKSRRSVKKKRKGHSEKSKRAAVKDKPTAGARRAGSR